MCQQQWTQMLIPRFLDIEKACEARYNLRVYSEIAEVTSSSKRHLELFSRPEAAAPKISCVTDPAPLVPRAHCAELASPQLVQRLPVLTSPHRLLPFCLHRPIADLSGNM